VLGLAAIALLGALALLLRVLGAGMRHLGLLAERLYDLPLFAPLWLEARAASAAARRDDVHALQEVRT
jgi:hypothetical protein